MTNPTNPSAPNSKQKRARLLLAVIGVLLAAALAAFIFGDAGSNWSVPPEAKALANPVPLDSTSVAAGKAIYEERCADCHGDAGDGKGADAWKYRAKPADFTDSSLLDSKTDGELYWKITVGRKPMPSFELKLSEDERWLVVDYIRTFAHPISAAPDASAPPK